MFTAITNELVASNLLSRRTLVDFSIFIQ
jgi:hypothetical protein